jgi:hypothetical protein
MDYLPSTVTYVSSQPNGNVAGNLVYWNGITMAPGSTGEYFIRATINNTATGNIVNI